MNKETEDNPEIVIMSKKKWEATLSLQRELVEAVEKRINQCCKDDLPPDQPYECCTMCKANINLIARAEATL